MKNKLLTQRRIAGALVMLLAFGFLFHLYPGKIYRIGASIHDHQLEPEPWGYAPSRLVPAEEFFADNNVNVAHFNGVLLLIHDDWMHRRYEIGLVDGRDASPLRPAQEQPMIAEDLAVLRKSHLRDMMATTKGKWAVSNYNGEFVTPPPGPFSGVIRMKEPGLGWIYWEIYLTVIEDRIVAKKIILADQFSS